MVGNQLKMLEKLKFLLKERRLFNETTMTSLGLLGVSFYILSKLGYIEQTRLFNIAIFNLMLCLMVGTLWWFLKRIYTK